VNEKSRDVQFFEFREPRYCANWVDWTIVRVTDEASDSAAMLRMCPTTPQLSQFATVSSELSRGRTVDTWKTMAISQNLIRSSKRGHWHD